MLSRKILVVVVAGFLIAPFTTSATDKIEAAKPQAPTAQKISVGKSIKLGSVDVVLNQVVPAGKESIGGEGFTEYNLTFTNTSPDKELVISNVVVAVNGANRAMVKDPDDIVNQGNSTGKEAATTAGSAAIGFVGGLFGPLGSIASMAGVSAAGNKIYVDDPQKWREELKKRGLQGSESGASVFPGETVTGSAWVKQNSGETATRIMLYLKHGGASRLVKLDLEGMPQAKIASKD